MQIKLDVLGSVVLTHATDVFALIAGAAFEGNRKGLYGLGAVRRCIVQYRGGIESSTEPDADRRIRDQLLFHRVREQAV